MQQVRSNAGDFWFDWLPWLAIGTRRFLSDLEDLRLPFEEFATR